MLTFTSVLTVTFFIITYLLKVAVCLVILMNMPNTSNLLVSKSFKTWNEVAAVLQSCNHTGTFSFILLLIQH
ncbi:hypothetical protein EB796_008326 [Bugula neritina]|uniref:Uncharacterized protein n=1 Tax=Bugula neritina TaxID=10212 RepID=A0A7J7K6Y4_BUGNE|nr:hypothetical protein EB796_008326 [Bugula neritina]